MSNVFERKVRSYLTPFARERVADNIIKMWQDPWYGCANDYAQVMLGTITQDHVIIPKKYMTPEIMELINANRGYGPVPEGKSHIQKEREAREERKKSNG